MPFATSPESNLRSTIVKGLILTLLLFFGIALASRCIVLYTGLSEWSAEMFVISRILYWLWLGIIYLYVTRREKQPLLLWSEQQCGPLFYLASVLGILLVVAIGNVGITYGLYYAGLYQPNPIISEIGKFSFALKFLISFTAGVVEELVIRGYLMPRLQLFLKGRHMPVIVSSVLFGLAHMRWGTLGNVLVPMFIGFVFAWHYQKYRNIRILIFCHVAWDIIGLMLIPTDGN